MWLVGLGTAAYYDDDDDDDTGTFWGIGGGIFGLICLGIIIRICCWRAYYANDPAYAGQSWWGWGGWGWGRRTAIIADPYDPLYVPPVQTRVVTRTQYVPVPQPAVQPQPVYQPAYKQQQPVYQQQQRPVYQQQQQQAAYQQQYQQPYQQPYQQSVPPPSATAPGYR